MTSVVHSALSPAQTSSHFHELLKTHYSDSFDFFILFFYINVETGLPYSLKITVFCDFSC